MGVELLFEPTILFFFITLNLGAILIQRQLCRQSFEMLGTNRVLTVYAFVLILGFLIAGWDSRSTFKEFAAYSLIISYFSLFLVSIVLMPSSLWLVSRRKFSISAIVLVGVSFWVFFVLFMASIDGLDRIIERGTAWFRVQAYYLSFIVTVSAVFAIGLKKPLKT